MLPSIENPVGVTIPAFLEFVEGILEPDGHGPGRWIQMKFDAGMWGLDGPEDTEIDQRVNQERPAACPMRFINGVLPRVGRLAPCHFLLQLRPARVRQDTEGEPGLGKIRLDADGQSQGSVYIIPAFLAPVAERHVVER